MVAPPPRPRRQIAVTVAAAALAVLAAVHLARFLMDMIDPGWGTFGMPIGP